MFVNVVGIEEERQVILCDYCTDVAKRSYKHKKMTILTTHQQTEKCETLHNRYTEVAQLLQKNKTHDNRIVLQIKL